MGILNSLFGFKWSLYLVKGEEVHYRMSSHNPYKIVGYCMHYYKDGNYPNPPWRVLLNYNKKHQMIELGSQHFTNDGDNLTTQLINEINKLDSNRTNDPNEPIFESAITKKNLKISNYRNLSFEEIMNGEKQSNEESFFSVMDHIFER